MGWKWAGAHWGALERIGEGGERKRDEGGEDGGGIGTSRVMRWNEMMFEEWFWSTSRVIGWWIMVDNDGRWWTKKVEVDEKGTSRVMESQWNKAQDTICGHWERNIWDHLGPSGHLPALSGSDDL